MVTPTDYLMVIAACEEPWRIHDRVLARRFLGSCYQGAGDHASALEQFSLALTDATSADIEAEIGHLLRLRGQALGQLGRLDDAVADLRRATAHEAHPLCAYWQAISLRELGDAFLRKAPREVDPAHPPEMLGFALQAYRAGRALFDAQVSSGIVPVARAVEQQMFRSYADNAVQVAMLENPRDLIAEIEAAGPRSATDLIAEGRAAKAQLSTGDAAFREARAIFGEDFLLFTEHGDLEHDFAAYLGNVGTYRVERRRYLQNRLGLTAALTQAQSSDVITERILALRIPGVVILNFHLGREQTFFTVIDAASGQVACAFAAWSEDERHACDNAYAAARASAAAAPTALQRNLLMRRAVNDVLEAYESALAPAFAGLMPLLAGKHVKIIPRFAMSNVPLHALRCAGKPLIASCDVSYAPTLGALLQIHHEEEPFPNNDLLIVRDAKRTPAYAGTLRAIDAERDATIDILADTTRADFMARLIEAPPRDLFFACHGRYDPDNPRTSILQLSATESVPFSTLFADPAIPACRSVMMGACESGLGRTLVSSESIGLPLAFLAAGARYAIGSLWQVNQIASAVLTAEFYRMLRGEARTPTNALNEAQRHILRMTREDVILWLRSNVPEKAEDWEQVIRTMEDPPFENPFFWAGFSITGDI
jgi:CHAT domain-containing protein